MRIAPLLPLVIAVLFLSIARAQDETAPRRLPRENLLVYRDAANHLKTVTSIADWQKRRAEILAGMQTVMGKLPGDEKRCPLDVQVHEEVDCGKYVRRLISYQAEPGSRVPAYLCLPKGVLEKDAPPVHAALCLHGTDNVIGHGTVVGLGRPNRNYAGELAERGWVTLAPNYPLLAKYQPELETLGWESGTLKAVWDNTRGLDLLETLSYVKHGHYAAIGHSLGGHNSVYTAVFDPRIGAVVTSCGLDSYLDYYQGKPEVWQPGHGWTQVRYMAKLADYRDQLDTIPFDFHEMIGALAPRPVLIIAPLRDSNFRHESVDQVAAAAGQVYQLYGQPNGLQVLHPDVEHDFPREMREAAYTFLEKSLNAKPPQN
ncbi:alpha/beta hydrolase family protein [Blastopirellula marina]|uniref:Alpha/beta hydrolase n=1 Tax=Blastopirellula marina TaxID=124 RepID=A0A2S8FLN4_9BACT|nr:alpha/beta hydrolase [Blastopirellula marina]PQO33067.1 alpha/beta hydrolase [Blastopirellula marina]PTL43234.1 alpha/beta hydrolase [Blastopirellula marina]